MAYLRTKFNIHYNNYKTNANDEICKIRTSTSLNTREEEDNARTKSYTSSSELNVTKNYKRRYEQNYFAHFFPTVIILGVWCFQQVSVDHTAPISKAMAVFTQMWQQNRTLHINWACMDVGRPGSVMNEIVRRQFFG